MSKQLATFWQQHVRQWKDSALTQAQYCKKHQLNPKRLSHHKRRLETQETAPVKTGFIALPIPEYLPQPELLKFYRDTHRNFTFSYYGFPCNSSNN
jgi:hypothetical protein